MASGLSPMEAAVQRTIVDLATTLRWRSYHTYDSRRSAGGYPDLTLARDRVVFAELKRQGEKPRADQVEWLDALAGGGGEVYLWRLGDFEEIKRVLSRDWRHFSTTRRLDGKLTRGLGQIDVAPSSGEHVVLEVVSDFWTPGSLWIPGHGRSDAA